MSSFAADLGIWALLVTGVVFCGIGLIGLVIFPDTKSRMFTAFRATAIGLGAVVLAVVAYGSYWIMTAGGDQYPALILHTLLLALVLAAGMRGMYGIIRDRVRNRTPAHDRPSPDAAGTVAKEGE